MSDVRLPAGTDLDSEEFWRALVSSEPRLPRCRSCGKGFFPPLPRCPWCGGDQVDLEADEGRGSVYSWVVVHMTLDPEFAAETPYTILAVDLDHGGRAMGRLLDGDKEPATGAPVELVPYEGADGATLIGFRLLADEG
ncbi:MAG TPA: OB-fold domain-containing protein [Solirubrobacterales bacterium]|nr:OB-fold domain-containing protein [Solirubrobacterales bacterium]